MGKGSRYSVPFRRRRKGKTNYLRRKKQIVSKMSRLIVRRSSKHVIAQIVVSRPNGDDVLVSAHSSELSHFGWRAPCGNVTAAYLTGLLLGYRALKKGILHAILDIGLQSPTVNSRVFATLKGACQAGLRVPHNEKIFISVSRLRGEHISTYASSLYSSDPELFNKMFSSYLSKGLDPTRTMEHVKQVEDKIVSVYMEV